MDSTSIKPRVLSFEQAPAYTQPEPGDARFNWLLPKDEIPGLCIGRVRLRGPIHKTPAKHAEFHQVYVVLQGQCTIHLDGQSHLVSEPSIVVIPKNTMHSVELTAGQSVEYAFVNQFK